MYCAYFGRRLWTGVKRQTEHLFYANNIHNTQSSFPRAQARQRHHHHMSALGVPGRSGGTIRVLRFALLVALRGVSPVLFCRESAGKEIVRKYLASGFKLLNSLGEATVRSRWQRGGERRRAICFRRSRAEKRATLAARARENHLSSHLLTPLCEQNAVSSY